MAAKSSIESRIVQEWELYTEEQHEVWSILYNRRMRELERTGSEVFLRGVERIGLIRDRVPNLEELNRQLMARTRWQAVPVSGFIPAAEFFADLAVRKFPTTITVRPRESMEYVPEPDIFHDVFGHVPLHADKVFADFLQELGAVAARATDDDQTLQMARLFWFTVEFGLIREQGTVKVYGSGLISSVGDGANALGPKCDRRPFSLQAVIDKPFEIDHFQDVLFVIDSFDQLGEAVREMERRIGA